jgi:Zn-dependent protease with chaperone function
LRLRTASPEPRFVADVFAQSEGWKELDVKTLRKALSLLLLVLLAVQTTWAGNTGEAGGLVSLPQDLQTAPAQAQSSAPPHLEELVKRSSLEIAALAEQFTLDQNAIRAKIETLKQGSKTREEAYKASAKSAEKEIELKERELANLKSNTEENQKTRKRIQCEIARIRKDLTEKTYKFLQSEIADDVQISKLNLAAAWRTESSQIQQKISNGTIVQRPYGDVMNIGNRTTRKPFKGQEDDQKWGQKEIDEARSRKLFPREIGDPVMTEYINRLANNLALNSDLRVPLKTYVVQQEMKKDGKPVLGKDGQPEQVANAMALPGGFLVLYAGVILESENESELAGVIAHEISHCAARHAQRLASKGKTFSIVQLAAAIGLQVFAPGLFYAASYLSYYLKGLLLQAIFQGMGLVFTIDALGVSREFELEADQLGMQYAWKSGYDPEGFIKLFDHMSQKEGYASHTSFFATHPAFGDRTLNSLKEYKVLYSIAPDRQFLTDTSEFQEVKERLRASLRKTRKEMRDGSKAPSLKQDDPAPEDCAEILRNDAPAHVARLENLESPAGDHRSNGLRGPETCKPR